MNEDIIMSKIKYVVAKDAADLNKIQDVAVRLVNRGRDALQIAAVATLIHAAKHGDWTHANRLVHAMPQGVNIAALVEWFVKFGGLTIGKAADENGKEVKQFVSWQGAKYIEAALNDAKATMWWTFKQQKAFEGFDADAALKAYIKKVNTIRQSMEGMSDEDKAKVSLTISDATFKAICELANFEAVIAGEGEEPAAKAA